MAKKLRAIAVGYSDTVRDIGEEFLVSDDFVVPSWCEEVEAAPAKPAKAEKGEKGGKKSDDLA